MVGRTWILKEKTKNESGDEMKKLVLYYSQARGNTKRIAEMIAKELDADIRSWIKSL